MPENNKTEFLNALKAAVDDITSIDRETLTSLLKDREGNDVSRFVLDMGIFDAGEQEAKAAPTYGIFDNPLADFFVKTVDGDDHIFSFDMKVEPSGQFQWMPVDFYYNEFKWDNSLSLSAQWKVQPTYTTRQYEEISIAA
jgi:hypothetical protein